jgi:DNA-directed RNA polymerase specialized sigma subunit
MNAKTFLERVETLDTITNNKLIERQQWLDMANSITAQMGGERVQSSGNPQKMADALNRCMDMVDDIVQKIAQLAEQKREVTNAIEQLNVDEYDVLHKIYIQHLTIEGVAKKKGKSKSWVKTVRINAIAHLQDIIDRG